MRMTSTEIREAAFIILLMREGHKPRPECFDSHAKKRIDDKWYQWQLRKIHEDELILSTPPQLGLAR